MSLRAELEEKRRKLQAVKEAREAGAKAKLTTAAPAAAPTATTPVRTTSPPPSAELADSPAPEQQQPARQVKLTTVANVVMVAAEPVSTVESYEKEVQTSAWEEERRGSETSTPPPAPIEPASPLEEPEAEPAPVAVDNTSMASADRDALREKRVQQISNQDSFSDFVTKAAFIMERAIAVNTDVCLESAAGIGEGETHVDLLQAKCRFVDDSVPRGYVVTSLKFQPNQTGGGKSEFFVASYAGTNPSRSLDPVRGDKGCVLLWSVHIQSRPAYRFTCPGDVATVTCTRHCPNLLIGTTYCGHIAQWDIRAGPNPIGYSVATPETHAFPVFYSSIHTAGSTNVLTTMSSEGVLCTWPVEKPVTTPLEVHRGFCKTEDDVPLIANCASSLEMDNNRVFVGGSDGSVYYGVRSGDKSFQLHQLHGHGGSVTSIECHPLTRDKANATVVSSDSSISNLVLTSSMDWSCRVYSMTSVMAAMSGDSSQRAVAPPFTEFEEFSDYVYDAKWSPTNPAVFAAGDGAGTLSLYHIGHATAAVPMAKLDITAGLEGGNGQSDPVSITKLAWAPDGQNLLAGDSSAAVTLINTTPEVAELVHGSEEHKRFDKFVQRHK